MDDWVGSMTRWRASDKLLPFTWQGMGRPAQGRNGCCNETKSNKSNQRYLLSLHEKINVNGSDISNKLLNKKILAIKSDRILYII